MAKTANLGPMLDAVTASFLAISCVAVALRCYVRVHLTRSFGYDDALVILALIVFTLFSIFIFLETSHGSGKHITDVPPAEYSQAIMFWYCGEITYTASSTLAKVAIGAMLLRLTIQRIHAVIIWAVIVSISIVGTIFVFVCMFQCSPVHYLWTSILDPHGGHCINNGVITALTYTHAIFCALSEFIYGILPIFMIWGLGMDKRTKISIILVLCLANFGTVATLIRLKALGEIKASTDVLYTTVDLVMWSQIEAGMAITAGSMVTLRPLFRNFYFPGSTRSASRSGASRRHEAGYLRHATPEGHELDGSNDRPYGADHPYGADQWNVKQGPEVSFSEEQRRKGGFA